MSARWNSNAKELFYVAPDGTSVEVSGTTAAFQSGIPKPLFKPKGLVSQPPDYLDWDASSGRKEVLLCCVSLWKRGRAARQVHSRAELDLASQEITPDTKLGHYRLTLTGK